MQRFKILVVLWQNPSSILFFSPDLYFHIIPYSGFSTIGFTVVLRYTLLCSETIIILIIFSGISQIKVIYYFLLMFLLFYLRHQIYLIIYNINTVTLAVIAIITQSECGYWRPVCPLFHKKRGQLMI